MLGNLGRFPGRGRRRTGAAILIVAGLIGLIVGRGERRARAETGPGISISRPPQCGAAYQLAQKKADAGRLVEASRLFAACSDLACGDEIWPSCVEESGALYATLPSIIPFAVDEDGTARPDVEIRLDGYLIARELAGVAIPVDPGQHQVSFSIASQVFATETVLAAEGERSRPISVTGPMAVRQRQLSAGGQDQ